MEAIKELELNFIGRGEVKGFEFTQIDKNEYNYIYQVKDEGRIYYEVFSRRIYKRFNQVSYPGASAFGVWAKTTTNLVKAYEYFSNI